MSQTLVLNLSDETHTIIQQQAEAASLSPSQLAVIFWSNPSILIGRELRTINSQLEPVLKVSLARWIFAIWSEHKMRVLMPILLENMRAIVDKNGGS